VTLRCHGGCCELCADDVWEECHPGGWETRGGGGVNEISRCATLSLLAYSHANYSVASTSTQAIAVDGALAFRGTHELADWLTDADCRLVAAPFGMVHAGFWRAYQSIAPLLPAAEVITGHSLGGALALLCGLDRLHRGEDVRVVTFGQPRALGLCTAQAMRHRFGDWVTRCVHNNDVVPRVPTRLMGYGHMGRLVYFDRHGLHRPGITWSELLRDRVAGRIEAVLERGTDGIRDHDLARYAWCAARMEARS